MPFSVAFSIYQSQVLNKLHRDADAILATLNERHSTKHYFNECLDSFAHAAVGDPINPLQHLGDLFWGDDPLKHQLATVYYEYNSANTLSKWAALIVLLSMVWIIFWDLPQDVKKDNDAKKKAREARAAQDKLS
ncbi:MAG: hypothetical protein WCO97_09430 [bacterium]